MWQAEILQRQGAWCRRFETSTEATDWIEGKIRLGRDTVNPVRDSAVHDLSERRPLPPPVVPPPFDDHPEWGIKK